MNKQKLCERDHSIGFSIKHLSNQIKRRMDHDVFRDMDEHMTGIQGWIIGFIYDAGQERDIFQRDIEQEFNIRRSSVTGLLQALEKNGFIKREAVDRDARLKKITLTPKAIENHIIIKQKIMGFDLLLESGITPEEKEVFLKIIKKVRRNLEQGDLTND